jgi:hypothetical protein
MSHGVGSGWLAMPALSPGVFDGLLEDRFMEVVSAFFSCHPVGVMAGRRKNPLPSPFFAGIWIFSIKSI